METEDRVTDPPDVGEIRWRHRRRRVAAATFARRSRTQQLIYIPHDMVTTTLPYKQREGLLTYERVDGDLHITISADARWGMPFGQDRLVFFWLATAFKQLGEPADNVIRFRAVNDLLRAFDLPISGRHRALLRERLLRAFGCKVEARVDAGEEFELRYQYPFIQRIALHFDSATSGEQLALWQNTITLSPGFAADIRKSAIPVDLETVIALKSQIPALDLYCWQAWRSFRLELAHQAHVAIPVLGPRGLLSQLGSATKDRSRARQLIRRWHAAVCDAWPECRNELSRDADTLLVRPSRPLDRARMALPGVDPDPPVPLLVDLSSSRGRQLLELDSRDRGEPKPTQGDPPRRRN